jgi:hypothetical protein
MPGKLHYFDSLMFDSLMLSNSYRGDLRLTDAGACPQIASTMCSRIPNRRARALKVSLCDAFCPNWRPGSPCKSGAETLLVVNVTRCQLAPCHIGLSDG